MPQGIARQQRKWHKLSIKTDPVMVEALSDFLVGVTGAEVEIAADDNPLLAMMTAFWEKKEGDDGMHEIFRHILEYGRELADIFGVAAPELSETVIDDQDWANSWKVHFKPFVIIPGLVIKPTWEPYRAAADEQVIEMDPGMAFGTGHHATTTMALSLVKTVLQEDACATVLDVGTGTGILGMAAVLFGARQVLGIDTDPEAVAAAIENIRRNGLNERMSVSTEPLAGLQNSYSLVVANIIHDTLVALADDLARVTAPGGKLIVSGILTGEQSDNISRCFLELGLQPGNHLISGEWSALLFFRPKE